MNKTLVLFVAIIFAWHVNAAPPRAGEVVGEELYALSQASRAAAKQAPTDLEALDTAALQRAKIQSDFDKLQQRAATLKQADKTYYAPWEPAAKRVDWQARDAILKANKPLSANEIAKALKIKPQEVATLLLKDQTNTRKVLFILSDGKVWVSSSKLPLVVITTVAPLTLQDLGTVKR
jgi:hypothetical protein